jgi:hypothetical protein
MRRAIVLFVAGVGVVVASVASASTQRNTFANGLWVGNGTITGGIFGDVNMEGSGTVRFRMTICNGRALSGQLTFRETFRGAVRGQRFTGAASGTLRIRDTETIPIAVRGPVAVSATVLGVTARTTAQGSGRIVGTGTARRMTGDLAIDARARQSASSAIGSTTVEAVYVATRTASAPC